MTLEESIAKFNLGELGISQFPQIAVEQLEKGIESESLIILAGMDEKDNSFEIRQYLEHAIEELSINIYESNNAAFILANYYVQEFKNDNLNVREAIRRIQKYCWDNSLVEIESKEHIYDSIKFGGIIATWYDYDEIGEHSYWIKRSFKSISEVKLKMEEEMKKDLLLWESEFLIYKLKELKSNYDRIHQRGKIRGFNEYMAKSKKRNNHNNVS